MKQYGAMLVKDHGEHKAKAEEVANQFGVTPPTGSSFGEKATYAKLKLLSGETFDRSFAKAMVKDHQDDIKEFRKGAGRTTPPASWPRKHCRRCASISRPRSG